jgi:hypothetical protein
VEATSSVVSDLEQQQRIEDRKYWLGFEKRLAELHSDLSCQMTLAQACGAQELAGALERTLWDLGGAILQVARLQ